MKQTSEIVTDSHGKRFEITTVDHTRAQSKGHDWASLTRLVCSVCGMTYYEYVETGEDCE